MPKNGLTRRNEYLAIYARILTRYLTILAAIFLLAAVLIYVNLPTFGEFLIVAEKPRPSDAIVVLAGDRGERTEYAADLYNRGFAPVMIISGGVLYDELIYARVMAEHARELGVSREAIILEDEAETTYENAVLTKKIIRQRGIKSALVVSSPYHMRRVKFIFDRVFQGSGVELVYVPVKDSWFEPDSWWKSPRGQKIVFFEYVKLLWYWLKY